MRLRSRIALVRAAHLNDYILVLRDIGAPVDRELSRSKLPGNVEETPDVYVSVPLALEWIARTGRDLRPMELGRLVAGKASLASLRPIQHAKIVAAQTGLGRLQALAELAQREDSCLAMRIAPEAGCVRVTCDMVGFDRHPFVCFAEWLNLQAVISVVRSVEGPSWYPRELCFVSANHVPDTVHTAFPKARILVGQPHTSIVVDRADLARPTRQGSERSGAALASLAAATDWAEAPAAWEFVSLLRMLVQPYIGGGHTEVAFAAELAGVSTRTLQRQLTQCGSSYSRVLEEARFSLARRGLEDPDLKVIDVAMIAGYESPQHFSRAFRRFTGVTPSAYRQLNWMTESPSMPSPNPEKNEATAAP